MVMSMNCSNPWAVLVKQGQLVLAQGREETDLGAVAGVPLTYDGRVAFQVDNLLAAIGATWALGLSADLMRTGVDTFDVGQAGVPGRFTVFQRGLATVVVDDAHNADALRALVAALDTFPGQPPRSAVFAPGLARHAAAWQAQAAILGAAFDQVTLTTDSSVPALAADTRLEQLDMALRAGPRLQQCVRQPDARLAIEQALAALEDKQGVLWIQTGEGHGGATLALELARQWAGRA